MDVLARLTGQAAGLSESGPAGPKRRHVPRVSSIRRRHVGGMKPLCQEAPSVFLAVWEMALTEVGVQHRLGGAGGGSDPVHAGTSDAVPRISVAGATSAGLVGGYGRVLMADDMRGPPARCWRRRRWTARSRPRSPRSPTSR